MIRGALQYLYSAVRIRPSPPSQLKLRNPREIRGSFAFDSHNVVTDIKSVQILQFHSIINVIYQFPLPRVELRIDSMTALNYDPDIALSRYQ